MITAIGRTTKLCMKSSNRQNRPRIRFELNVIVEGVLFIEFLTLCFPLLIDYISKSGMYRGDWFEMLCQVWLTCGEYPLLTAIAIIIMSLISKNVKNHFLAQIFRYILPFIWSVGMLILFLPLILAKP